MIAHNLFGFDVFFIEGYRATAWAKKDLNFGGTNLKNIHYGNIAGEIKFIDTLKCYQKTQCFSHQKMMSFLKKVNPTAI